MKKPLFPISILILALVLFTGCGSFVDSFQKGFEEGYNNASGAQTVLSNDAALSITFPNGWQKMELNDTATIEMGRAAEEQYMIIFEESAVDFADDFTVDDYADIIINNMKPAVENAVVSNLDNTTIGENITAKQIELAGLVSGIKVKYFITFFKSNDVFYQFTAWSLQSKYDQAKPVFDSIIYGITF